MEEQWFYSGCTPHPFSKAEPSHRTEKTNFDCLYLPSQQVYSRNVIYRMYVRLFYECIVWTVLSVSFPQHWFASDCVKLGRDKDDSSLQEIWLSHSLFIETMTQTSCISGELPAVANHVSWDNPLSSRVCEAALVTRWQQVKLSAKRNIPWCMIVHQMAKKNHWRMIKQPNHAITVLVLVKLLCGWQKGNVLWSHSLC